MTDWRSTAVATSRRLPSPRAQSHVPRPDQLQIAQLAVEKAQSALNFAQKNYDRTKTLAADQGVRRQRAVEQVSAPISLRPRTISRRWAQKSKLNMVKNTPTPEELAQEEAKVAHGQGGPCRCSHAVGDDDDPRTDRRDRRRDQHQSRGGRRSDEGDCPAHRNGPAHGGCRCPRRSTSGECRRPRRANLSHHRARCRRTSR